MATQCRLATGRKYSKSQALHRALAGPAAGSGRRAVLWAYYKGRAGGGPARARPRACAGAECRHFCAAPRARPPSGRPSQGNPECKNHSTAQPLSGSMYRDGRRCSHPCRWPEPACRPHVARYRHDSAPQTRPRSLCWPVCAHASWRGSLESGPVVDAHLHWPAPRLRRRPRPFLWRGPHVRARRS